MPPRTNKFQQLILLLNKTLEGKAQITESQMLQDAVTGESREVDIWIKIAGEIYETSIGIEVVGWSRRAGTPWVEKMRAKHENLPTDRLILVSESGFTKPAIKKAHHYNIETISIDQVLDANWPLFVNLEKNGIFLITMINFNCTAICRYPDGTREQIPAPLQAQLQSGDNILTVGAIADIALRCRQHQDAIESHMRELDTDEIVGPKADDFWCRYIDPNGMWKPEDDGERTQIEEIRIGLRVVRTATPVEFSAGSYKGNPFVAGSALKEETPLTFVLTRRPDGMEKGMLLDGEGFKNLWPDQGLQDE